jgi:hypothetical protein
MRKQHVRGRPHDEPEVTDPAPLDPEPVEQQEEARSLDLVQRLVVSALAIVIGGSFSAGLAAYIALKPTGLDQGSIIGLWVMTGFAGLLTAAAVLIINRRHHYSPLLVFGLLPMVLSAYWVFT